MVIISVRATTDLGSSVRSGEYRCDLLVHGQHGNPWPCLWLHPLK
jgi:hypothetical protein